MKYIQAINTGKGFITHEDQEEDGLAFNVFDNLVTVIGEEKVIDAWVTRVKGKDITEAEYLLEKNKKMKINLETEIATFDTEKSDRETKLVTVDNYLLTHL